VRIAEKHGGFLFPISIRQARGRTPSHTYILKYRHSTCKEPHHFDEAGDVKRDTRHRVSNLIFFKVYEFERLTLVRNRQVCSRLGVLFRI
jgi:hypothetical protein